MNHQLRTLIGILACLLFTKTTIAQVNTTSDKALQNWYGDIVPGTSVSLNTLSTTALMLPDTRAGEWPEIRNRIMKRLNSALGTGPVELYLERGGYDPFRKISKWG